MTWSRIVKFVMLPEKKMKSTNPKLSLIDLMVTSNNAHVLDSAAELGDRRTRSCPLTNLQPIT
jgi:hypothetical protein